jgi:hypothetical protein
MKRTTTRIRIATPSGRWIDTSAEGTLSDGSSDGTKLSGRLAAAPPPRYQPLASAPSAAPIVGLAMVPPRFGPQLRSHHRHLRGRHPSNAYARGAVRGAGERPGRACSSTRRVLERKREPTTDGFMPSPFGQVFVIAADFSEPSRRRCWQERAVPLRYLHQLRSTPLVHLP